MRDFKTFKVWEKAHQLSLALYKTTVEFPQAERYGLIGQIRRAGASVAANIAEGCGRRTQAELCNFLNIAMGSASELQYHLLLARDLKLLAKPDHKVLEDQVTEVKRMLTSLMQRLRAES